MTATTGELYKALQDVEAWIERATEEAETEASRDEDDYESGRAFAWLCALEDRRDMLLTRIDTITPNIGRIIGHTGDKNMQLRTCADCGEQIRGDHEQSWAEHLSEKHPQAWKRWYHAKWQEEADHRHT